MPLEITPKDEKVFIEKLNEINPENLLVSFKILNFNKRQFNYGINFLSPERGKNYPTLSHLHKKINSNIYYKDILIE